MPTLTEVTQFIIAVTVAYNVWQTWRVKANVQKIEIATNSMKDALVKATGDAAMAQGTAIGLERGRSEARDTTGG